MNKLISADESESLVPSQNENVNADVVPAAEGDAEASMDMPKEELVTPHEPDEITAETIQSMTSAEFGEYMNSVRNGERKLRSASVADTGSSAADGDKFSGDSGSSAAGADVTDSNTDETDAVKEDKTEPYKVFGSETEYEAEVQKRIDHAVGRRMKKEKQRLDTYEKIFDTAARFYGGDNDPIQRLITDLEEQAASDRNMDVEEYRKEGETARKARLYDEEHKRIQESEKERQKIIETWNRDAEQLRILYPEFDLETAMKDHVFKEAIVNGQTVVKAYAQMISARTPVKQELPVKQSPARKTITQNAQSSRSGTGSATRNPASMSAEDFKRYIERCRG